MTEKTLQDWIIKTVRRDGGLAYKTVAVGRRGFPDLTCISPEGAVVFIEVKHPNGRGRVSIHQQKTIDDLNRLGANAYVIASKDEFINLWRPLAGSDRRD